MNSVMTTNTNNAKYRNIRSTIKLDLIASIVIAASYFTISSLGFSSSICACIIVLSSFICGLINFYYPHEIFWRFVMVFNMMYVACLVVLLYQATITPMAAREILSAIDPSLGRPLEGRSYATECSLTYDNLIDKADLFIIFHIMECVVKAIIFRDRTLLWVVSCCWELVELSTSFFVPNFAECWWDSILLDVFIFNAIGIEIGLWINRKLDLEPRNWVQNSGFDIQSVADKLQHFVLQFTPFRCNERVSCETTRNFRHYVWLQFLLVICCIATLNGFILKLYLWIPANHPLFAARETLLHTNASVLVPQFYYFITNDPSRAGSHSSPAMAGAFIVVVLLMELSLCYKLRPIPFPDVPPFNQVMYMTIVVAYLIFSFIVLGKYRTGSKKAKKQRFSRALKNIDTEAKNDVN